MGNGQSVSACLSLVTWALVSQKTAQPVEKVLAEFTRISELACLALCRRNKRAKMTERVDMGKREEMRLTRSGRMACNGGGGATKMMGFKERAFAPLVAVSLEELVPQDQF